MAKKKLEPGDAPMTEEEEALEAAADAQAALFGEPSAEAPVPQARPYGKTHNMNPPKPDKFEGLRVNPRS